jgi:F0F1-type ATP synthase assembly protein I
VERFSSALSDLDGARKRLTVIRHIEGVPNTKEERQRTQWRELAVYANVGMTIAVALVGCGALGWWLDKRLHSSPIGLLAGLFLGLLIAARELWKLIRAAERTTRSTSRTHQ